MKSSRSVSMSNADEVCVAFALHLRLFCVAFASILRCICVAFPFAFCVRLHCAAVGFVHVR